LTDKIIQNVQTSSGSPDNDDVTSFASHKQLRFPRPPVCSQAGCNIVRCCFLAR
jgi:hypothetical protein